VMSAVFLQKQKPGDAPTVDDLDLISLLNRSLSVWAQQAMALRTQSTLSCQSPAPSPLLQLGPLEIGRVRLRLREEVPVAVIHAEIGQPTASTTGCETSTYLSFRDIDPLLCGRR
jgi:hypothetical protein